MKIVTPKEFEMKHLPVRQKRVDKERNKIANGIIKRLNVVLKKGENVCDFNQWTTLRLENEIKNIVAEQMNNAGWEITWSRWDERVHMCPL